MRKSNLSKKKHSFHLIFQYFLISGIFLLNLAIKISHGIPKTASIHNSNSEYSQHHFIFNPRAKQNWTRVSPPPPIILSTAPFKLRHQNSDPVLRKRKSAAIDIQTKGKQIDEFNAPHKSYYRFQFREINGLKFNVKVVSGR